MNTGLRGPHVAVTFDVDGFANWIGSLGITSPGVLSRGEFEHVGLGRVLALLAELRIQGTFFVPGSTAVTFPGEIRAIRDGGHEIAHHGWVHEPPARLPEDEERRVLLRGLEALDRVVGVRPVGYRSPGWDNSPRTVELLLEHGFEYDSSLMGNDYSPYWCRVGDSASQVDGFAWGNPVDLVEMPVAWHLDDFPYFEPVAEAGQSGLRTPSSVLEVWRAEIDYLVREVRDGILILTLHPQVIGRGHRMAMLRSFLEYAGAQPGLRFSSCIDYSRAWRAGRHPSLPIEQPGPQALREGGER
jgi:peptidoglycan-N-acetylglucosamine deacetylase